MAVNEHNQIRIMRLLEGIGRGAFEGAPGVPGVSAHYVAAELDITVDTARRNLRELSLAQRVDVWDNPVRRGNLYGLPMRP